MLLSIKVCALPFVGTAGRVLLGLMMELVPNNCGAPAGAVIVESCDNGEY